MKDKKIIMIGILGFALLSIALFSFDAQGQQVPIVVVNGTVLAQGQLDSLNPETFDFQCQQSAGNPIIEFKGGEWYYKVAVSCLSVSQSVSNYLFLSSTIYPSFSINKYAECLEVNLKSYCISEAINKMVSKVTLFKATQKNKLIDYQTIDVNSVLGTDFDNLELPL